ncbi:glycosyltransferase family 4 protein [Candidatus Nomurabacteria bacterium]|nr:glycosyltransferase family 4 protein [Candidatus Nomurabacteria bacterium]
MKLLIITQIVDQNDAVLGFFHNWLLKFSKKFEQITVICLQKGECNLPDNVKVLSLGKEKKVSRLQYLINFYKYLWRERKNYDTVFVHMNQEYVVLAGLIWRIFGKKIVMWRNHPYGNFMTRLAIFLSNKVLCTSKESFTAKFSKTKIMPVGVDTDFFQKISEKKDENSILFLSRISSYKNAETLINALDILQKKSVNFTASFIGDAPKNSVGLKKELINKTQSLHLDSKVQWLPGVSNEQTVFIYNQFEIFVNDTTPGSFDKTILEAMSCQTLTLASNPSLRDSLPEELFFEHKNAVDLASKIENIFNQSAEHKRELVKKLRKIVIDKYSLNNLVHELNKIFNNL